MRLDPWRQKAELRLACPDTYRAHAKVGAELRAMRAEAEAELQCVEEQLGQAAARRRVLLDRIRACDRALAGTGIWDDGRKVHRFFWPKGLPDAGDAIDDTDCRVVRGVALRTELTDVLRMAARPLTINDLRRVLAANGLKPPGRASQAISNALAVEEAAGRVVRLDRGWFEAA